MSVFSKFIRPYNDELKRNFFAEKIEENMNERIGKLAEQCTVSCIDGRGVELNEIDVENFAKLIVYDFLDELTNDDSLGEARIATIRRLAEKWGVSRERTN